MKLTSTLHLINRRRLVCLIKIHHVSGKLVVYKSGDEKWRLIDDLSSPSPYDNVILRKGKFYAVDFTGKLVLVNNADLNLTHIANSVFDGDKKFLVDSDGELLLVDMYLSVGPADNLGFNDGFQFYEEFDCFMSERTVKFRVFRLDEDAEQWIEVFDLDDIMIFLGDNCTFTTSVLDFCGDNFMKGNRVFFTDQYSNREDEGVPKNRGIGVFDLETGSIGPITSPYLEIFWPPPDWVYPTATIQAGLDQLNIVDENDK